MGPRASERRAWLVVVWLAYASVGCGKASSPVQPAPSSSDHLAIVLGDARLVLDPHIVPREALAMLIRSDGTQVDVTSETEFASSNPAVVAISPRGVLSPTAPGQAQITGQARGLFASTPITVVPLPAGVDRFYLAMNTPLQIGFVYDLSAYKLIAGRNVDVTSETIFSSSNPSVATISQGRTMTTLQLGRTQITAVDNGLTSVGTLEVIPRGNDPYPDQVKGLVSMASPEGAPAGLGLPWAYGASVQISGGELNGQISNGPLFSFRNVHQAGFDLLVSRDGFRPLRVPVSTVPATFDNLTLEPTSSMAHLTVEGTFCDGDEVSWTFRPVNTGFFLVTDVWAFYPYDFNFYVHVMLDGVEAKAHGPDLRVAPLENHRVQITSTFFARQNCGRGGSLDGYGKFRVSYLRPR